MDDCAKYICKRNMVEWGLGGAKLLKAKYFWKLDFIIPTIFTFIGPLIIVVSIHPTIIICYRREK